MTKEQAIRNFINKDIRRLTHTPDSIAWSVSFWYRIHVDRYDVISALQNMGEKVRYS
jgi:hypothetical protein